MTQWQKTDDKFPSRIPITDQPLRCSQLLSAILAIYLHPALSYYLTGYIWSSIITNEKTYFFGSFCLCIVKLFQDRHHQRKRQPSPRASEKGDRYAICEALRPWSAEEKELIFFSTVAAITAPAWRHGMSW